MISSIEFCGIEKYNQSIKLRLSNGVYIYLLDIRNNIWTIEVGLDTAVYSFAKGIVEDYEFFEKLCGVKAFDIIFHNARFLIDINTDIDNIIKLYKKNYRIYTT